MATPSRFADFPLSLRRLVRRAGKCIMLWDMSPGNLRHTEVVKFRAELPAAERNKHYWVIRCPLIYMDITAGNFTVLIVDPLLVRGRGFDTWDDAEEFFDERAQADTGHPGCARGLRGLMKIGSED